MSLIMMTVESGNLMYVFVIQNEFVNEQFNLLISGCYKCGEDGHMARDCPSAGGGGGGGGRGKNTAHIVHTVSLSLPCKF